jgi:hypothetical protein
MYTLKIRSFHAIFLIVTALIVLSCTTLQKKYAGYTVVSKSINKATRIVPVWISSCVRQNGEVRCQVKWEGNHYDADPGAAFIINSCTVSCDHKHGDKWIKEQIGTTNETYFEYILRLKSPTGEVVEDKVPEFFFNEVREGQVFPTTK